MNILFLTLLDFSSLSENELYCDILREFTKGGDEVYVISPIERRIGGKSKLIEEGRAKILKLNIGRIQKTSALEKGISMLTIKAKYKRGINRFFKNVKFDMVMYSTPPITLCGVVEYVKKRDRALTYLMLKDIFPQNAVDLQMIGNKGPGSFLYKYFRKMEKHLYDISDLIGCMSPANVTYLLEQNPELSKEKVHVCPNSSEATDYRLSEEEKLRVREEYDIPKDRLVIVCGGNFGKPHGVDFLISCLKKCEDKSFYFVLAGSGTEYHKLQEYEKDSANVHVKLLGMMEKSEFDRMAGCCDVGLVLLDHRFTIPNFPYRLLSYLQAGIPVLAATDVHTDVGVVAEQNGFGAWCESNDTRSFLETLSRFEDRDFRKHCGDNAYKFFMENYTSEIVKGIIDSELEKYENIHRF